jgi:hypothetical protein
VDRESLFDGFDDRVTEMDNDTPEAETGNADEASGEDEEK